MEDIRKHEDIKLVTTEGKRNYLLTEKNYHTTKTFFEKSLVLKIKRLLILMKKSVYLGASILEIHKTEMHEIW